MALQRWDPFGEMFSLRDAMDRLFQESFVRPTSAMIAGARGGLPLDVIETSDAYLVRATMPGVQPENIQIALDGETLSIRGETRGEPEQEGQNWVLRERRPFSYRRTITLPGPVNPDTARAEYEHGVLTLTIPKAEAARPREIKVQLGASRPVNGEAPQAARPQTTDTAAPQAPGAHEENSDIVTRASEDSFPASDAPAWPRETPP
jgi:HSP20 family protein